MFVFCVVCLKVLLAKILGSQFNLFTLFFCHFMVDYNWIDRKTKIIAFKICIIRILKYSKGSCIEMIYFIELLNITISYLTSLVSIFRSTRIFMWQQHLITKLEKELCLNYYFYFMENIIHSHHVYKISGEPRRHFWDLINIFFSINISIF